MMTGSPFVNHGLFKVPNHWNCRSLERILEATSRAEEIIQEFPVSVRHMFESTYIDCQPDRTVLAAVAVRLNDFLITRKPSFSYNKTYYFGTRDDGERWIMNSRVGMSEMLKTLRFRFGHERSKTLGKSHLVRKPDDYRDITNAIRQVDLCNSISVYLWKQLNRIAQEQDVIVRVTPGETLNDYTAHSENKTKVVEVRFIVKNSVIRRREFSVHSAECIGVIDDVVCTIADEFCL